MREHQPSHRSVHDRQRVTALLVPGWEGNINIKWLHRIHVVDQPYMLRDEAASYTDLMPGGKARWFTFEMEAKSVITRPSGGDFPALVGKTPVLTVGSYWPFTTTLVDYIRRAMPYPSPGSLRPDDLYAVAAFILFKNEIIANDFVVDATTLPRIVMPNANGFVSDPRPDVSSVHEKSSRR